MKTNNKKLIVGALALVAGAGLVGSVSGSFAWFQYSTRTTAAFVGTAAHCSENMEIKVAGGAWQKDYTVAQTTAALSSVATNGSVLTPLTTGAIANNVALTTLYKNPIYQYESMSSWGTAASANYIQFSLKVRVLDVDGANVASYLAKEVYLTNLTIRDVTGGADLSDAVRVHIACGSNYALMSKAGGDTNTFGALDLNNDGVADKQTGYEWDSPADCVYGTADSVQSAYAQNASAIVANDTNATLTGGLVWGTTPATDAGLEFTITIWLEGWQKLDHPETGNAEASAAESAVWNSSYYVGKQFNVGFRFAVQPHADH